MSLDIRCNIGVFSQGASLDIEYIQYIAQYIKSVYEHASSGVLNITPSYNFLEYFNEHAQYATAFDLHEFAAILNKNPVYLDNDRRTGPSVQNISLIFAEKYWPPYDDALGVMFDRGFITDDDPNESGFYTGFPREACAIFIGSIDDSRQSHDEFINELIFTTLHELGHVFNLDHTFDELTYLTQSKPNYSYDPDTVNFNEEQKNWLSHCDSSPYVWPGGSKFQDFGPSGSLNCHKQYSTQQCSQELELRINMEHIEFYRFEPVELDIALEVSNGIKKSFFVPNTIDPGYKSFRIWIEEPSGSRRLYKPLRHYCSPPKKIYISNDKPFQRDISIFAESGGYTFKNPGLHRIWCDFHIGRRGVIKSNILEINVKPTNISDRSDIDKILTSKHVPQLLYHRVDPLNGKLLHELSNACENIKHNPTACALRYAIGKAWLAQSMRNAKISQPSSSTELKNGFDELSKSLNFAELGNHRCNRATKIMEKVKKNKFQFSRSLFNR